LAVKSIVLKLTQISHPKINEIILKKGNFFGLIFEEINVSFNCFLDCTNEKYAEEIIENLQYLNEYVSLDQDVVSETLSNVAADQFIIPCILQKISTPIQFKLVW
jgi:hypothetical protein